MKNTFYKQLKREAKEAEIYVCHDRSAEQLLGGFTYNGFTVGFRASSFHPDNRMIEVAIAYCAIEDKFKKKIGKQLVLERLLGYSEPGYIILPLGQMLREEGPRFVAETLQNMFLV